MTMNPLLRREAGALLLCLALAACASKPPAPLIVNIPPPPPVELEPAPAVVPDDITPLLNYSQSLRRMSPAELLRELSSLGQQQARGPKWSLQTAMALMLTRGNGDLARAQALLDSVATSADAADAPYKPLAQLLSASCADSRRQADHIDRLAVQLKENQRRTDQLSDMLEALKTIERTLPARPATSAQAGTK